jgi:arylsulfatase A-like enzyme
VPLVIAPPRGEHLTVRHDPVSSIDVATTLAALGGAAGFGTGDDLRRPAAAGLSARMESAGKGGPRGGVAPSRAVVAGRRQLIVREGRSELYDLEADRAQQHNLAATAPDEVERLRAMLPAGVTREGRATLDGDLDDAERRNLRALGYLD